jgi:hypothetical protein
MTNSLQNRADILQERFALKAASYLTAGTADLPYEISERLRAARAQAVSKRGQHRFWRSTYLGFERRLELVVAYRLGGAVDCSGRGSADHQFRSKR